MPNEQVTCRDCPCCESLPGMCDVIPMTDGKPGEPGYVVAADYRRRGQ